MNQNILVIRSGAIGDVLMTTPLVRGIRQKFPKAHISYLIGNWSKDVLVDNKNIDELIAFDDRIIFKKKILKIIGLIKKLRQKKFDTCIILDKSYLWNLFALFCGIPKRYGFARRWEGFPNTRSIEFDGSKYELDYYLDIGKLLGINIKNKKMELQKDQEFADKFIRRNISPDWSKKFMKKKTRWKFWFNNQIIGIGAGGANNPGQEAPWKRWPKEEYVALINILMNRDKYHIILFGGPEDEEINQYILRSVRNSSGKQILSATNLTIQQSASLINKCKYFITNDSGLMHIAATTKTKIIAIFGPTSEERFAPRHATVIKGEINCRPCYDIYGKFKKCEDKLCISAISCAEVFKKIR